ncbi:hypothetical protein [Deinococcus sp. Marseille-Q6407]|uniref:hypothetical protein n=1 Tax=Deinococcus sp. Marseille-Q6407 TaxID=2969223 RepID=UPI0021BF74AC|nr:hypothetical protein [Deinococcus sp. Marseille-Q6407]
MDPSASPTPPDHQPEPRRSALPSGWLVGLAGVLIGLLGLGAAFWMLRDQPAVNAPVPVAEETAQAAASQPATAATPDGTTATTTIVRPGQTSAPATTETLDAAGGHSALLDLQVPSGFAPPKLENLSFADAFAQAAAYRGWQCQQTEVILFSDAHQALPAVQERLLELGYQVSDTETALGEDHSWLAKHPDRPDLFGSFSSGQEGRGNVSLCSLPN